MKKLLIVLIAVTALLALRDNGSNSGGSGNGNSGFQLASPRGDTYLGTKSDDSYCSALLAGTYGDNSFIIRKQGIAAFDTPTGNVYCSALLASGTTGDNPRAAKCTGLFS